MLKYLIICLLTLSLLCGCGEWFEQKKGKEQPSMDEIVLNVLTEMDINPQSVRRVNAEDAIYYQLPVTRQADLENTANILSKYIKGTGYRNLNTDPSPQPNKLIRAYYNPVDKRNYVIEIHSYVVRTPTHTTFTEKPQVCIIVDDFGNFDGPLLDAFCAIRPPITFAIMPGLPFTKVAMQKAIANGHEVIIHIPMEAEDENANPGSNAILHNMSSREIYDRVKSYFAEIPVATGANQHMGSRITQSKPLMRASLRLFAEKDYFFIDSRTTANTVAREIANELNIAFEERNLFLDSPENTDTVLADRLNDTIRLIEQKNKVLVITHCHDRGRLQRLQNFISEIQKLGYEIVPAAKYAEKQVRS